jgi:Rhodopirellula transposase DDE domain
MNFILIMWLFSAALAVHIGEEFFGLAKWYQRNFKELPPSSSVSIPVFLCHISQNWRGRPLTSRQVVINLINHNRTKPGLRIPAKLDKHHDKTKIKVTDEEFKAISLERDRAYPTVGG